MRIIAGKLSGRNFTSPHNNTTHPMSDKVRGALFNSMGDISGLRFLDAFSGTGALSFEAISRNAQYVLAIESDNTAARSILHNSKELGINPDFFKIIQANCYSWSGHNANVGFDVVIVDPPFPSYEKNPNQIFNLLPHVFINGLFVVSMPPSMNKEAAIYHPPSQLSEVLAKSYGDAELVFYRRIA